MTIPGNRVTCAIAKEALAPIWTRSAQVHLPAACDERSASGDAFHAMKRGKSMLFSMDVCSTRPSANLQSPA